MDQNQNQLTINKEGQEMVEDQREYIKHLENILTTREEVINLLEAKVEFLQRSSDKKNVNDDKLWNNFTILKHSIIELQDSLDSDEDFSFINDVLDTIEEDHQHS